MRNGEALERSEELALVALRRAFLIDMAWPVGSDAICRLFGLPAASEDVLEEEVKASFERMERFTNRGEICALVHQAARDCDEVLSVVDDPEERSAWLATYALAVMNLLQSAGYIEVNAA